MIGYVARAVLPYLEMRWILVDGLYAGTVEHTWLISYTQPPCIILDLYSVARIPLVQLVDHGCRASGEVSFHFALFAPNPFGHRRKDIRRSVVQELDRCLVTKFRKGGRIEGDRPSPPLRRT
jgi:hypothetical protein